MFSAKKNGQQTLAGDILAMTPNSVGQRWSVFVRHLGEAYQYGTKPDFIVPDMGTNLNRTVSLYY